MSYYINSGWSFKIDNKMSPNGAVIVGSGVNFPSLSRRKIEKKYPYMKYRIFDAQLYLDKLDPHESPKPCYNLISYPWSGAKNLPDYDSNVFNQKQYKDLILKNIVNMWNDREIASVDYIKKTISDVINFQIRLGCYSIVIPGPLTRDPSTDFSEELRWLDFGLTFIKENGITLPVYATLALSDSCLRYSKTNENNLLDLITDAISSRNVTGIYFIIEQMSEPNETRYLGNFNAIQSCFEIVHRFANENKLNVITNYFGPFGIALSAVGASIWATDWYKSLVRCRLADKIGIGRVRPLFWSTPLASDIHLKNDIEILFKNGLFPDIYEETSASRSLQLGLSAGKSVQDIPAWRYALGNRTASVDHYRLSMESLNSKLNGLKGKYRLDFIQNWLEHASVLTTKVDKTLGDNCLTNTMHVNAWRDAFSAYRLSHNI